jgi:curved DNA-binding protein CbpA
LFKAGFRKLAKDLHPDHGGDAADFRKLQDLKADLGI